MTISELQDTIIKMEARLKGSDAVSLDSRALSAMRKELIENFKLTGFTNSQERQENWTGLQVLLDALKEKQVILDKENEIFAAEAEAKIAAVKEALDDETNSGFTKETIDVLKKQIAETGEFIRQSNWPNKERRTAAWDRFKEYREALRLKEDMFYNQLRAERTRLTEQSSSITQAVLYAIRACHPDAEAEKLVDIAVTLASLSGTEETDAKETLHNSISNEEIKAQNPLKIKSEGLRDLRKFVIENRDGITREDKQRIFAAIDEVQEDLDNAWGI
ncbi:MAG: hypothetical protein WAT20_05375, partial [Ferruginibacter sp.]